MILWKRSSKRPKADPDDVGGRREDGHHHRGELFAEDGDCLVRVVGKLLLFPMLDAIARLIEGRKR